MLSSKKKYLQIALNGSLGDAVKIISQLPASDRIIVEAGTPLLKEEGARAITVVKNAWERRLGLGNLDLTIKPEGNLDLSSFLMNIKAQKQSTPVNNLMNAYIVADYKAMDRGATEVHIAASAGASAVTVLGQAPVETIDLLIETCKKRQIDSIIDMMNVDQPYKILRKLKQLPDIVMVHSGVDETDIGKKPFPVHMINKIKGSYDVMVDIGGGDTIRQVQSAIFNGADIVMVWRDFYNIGDNKEELARQFLERIK